ncbi:MAG: clostripain-related cysteine peptidase, partial [Armatimonadota bacterium]
LVYMDADNDLESSGVANVNQMEMIGSTRDVHILVQIDRAAGHDSSNGDWTDTRRYLVTRDFDSDKINSLRLDDPPLGELDMGSWRTLAQFVEWGMRESPSDNYCLVIWDHGTGWQFKTLALPQHRYIASDETNYSAMNVTDIPRALTGKGISVLAFDACLMQQIEVAYELQDCAGYMVGSPSAEPSPGYDYFSWISRVATDTTPQQLCEILVNEYVAAYPPPRKGIAHSAVDLSRVGELVGAVDEFARLLIGSGDRRSALESARVSALNYSTADGSANRNYLDLVDYASRCASAIGVSAQGAYARLSQAADRAIVAEAHGPDMRNAHGLGIYVPPA